MPAATQSTPKYPKGTPKGTPNVPHGLCTVQRAPKYTQSTPKVPPRYTQSTPMVPQRTPKVPPKYTHSSPNVHPKYTHCAPNVHPLYPQRTHSLRAGRGCSCCKDAARSSGLLSFCGCSVVSAAGSSDACSNAKYPKVPQRYTQSTPKVPPPTYTFVACRSRLQLL